MAISAARAERHAGTVPSDGDAQLQPALTKLAAALVAVMAAQASLGLRRPDYYHDAEWIAATWWGNDWVTLLLAIPLFAAAHAGALAGSTRATLLYFGMLGYAVYNYAYYLFGAALNVFFPLYVCALLLAALSLITALSGMDAARVASHFRVQTAVRAIGGYFAFVGVSLAIVWIAMWAAYAFAGRPTPIEPEAFKLIAALDLVLMVPALTIGGSLLWRRKPRGYLISSIAGVQASLYLIVLTVNSVVFLVRGLAAWPGELPIWGTLAVLTTAATVLLLSNVTSAQSPRTGAKVFGRTSARGLIVQRKAVKTDVLNGPDLAHLDVEADMPRRIPVRALAIIAVFAGLSMSFSAARISPTEAEDDLVSRATFVLERAVGTRAAAIPVSVLLRARAIAVFPHAVKHDARYMAEGIMSARGATPNYWTPPAVLEFEGAIPLDLESRTADFIFIAQTPRGLDYLIQDRFVSPVIIPIAPGALADDGPVRIDADLLAYMHFGDYFAGVTVNDWMVSESKPGNARLYGRPYSTEDVVRGAGFFNLPPPARLWRNALMACFRELS